MATTITGNAYSGSVTTIDEVFTFSAEKQDLRITNNGSSLLELIIDGDIIPIESGRFYINDGYITTFRLRSRGGEGYYNLSCADSLKNSVDSVKAENANLQDQVDTMKGRYNFYVGTWTIGAIAETTGVVTENLNSPSAYSSKFFALPNTKYILTLKRPNPNMYIYIYEYNASTGKRVFSLGQALDKISFLTAADTQTLRIATYVAGVHTLEGLSPTDIQVTLVYDDDEYVLPKYYESYIAGKIADIKTLAQGCMATGDVFGWISDMHWTVNAQKSPALINTLAKALNISFVVQGGDAANGLNETAITFLRNAVKNTKTKVYNVVGNHEYQLNNDENKISYLFDTPQINDVVYGSVEHHYYYVDNTPKKIRYIFLNPFSYVNTPPSYCAVGCDETQRTWLTDVALNVETGWTIIIFTHALYDINIGTDAINAVDSNVINIINSYAGNGKIACVIQGHSHRDRIVTMNSGIPCVIVTCDKYQVWNDGNGHDDLNVTRTAGTTTEQAFDIVVLDTANKKLSFVRIGAPALNGTGNTPGTAVEVREVTYT